MKGGTRKLQSRFALVLLIAMPTNNKSPRCRKHRRVKFSLYFISGIAGHINELYLSDRLYFHIPGNHMTRADLLRSVSRSNFAKKFSCF